MINDVAAIAYAFAICFTCVLGGLAVLAVPDYPRCKVVGCPHHLGNK